MAIGLAEPGFATACYVEIEDYPRRTLIAGQRAGYLEPAPIWDDLKTFSAGPWRGQVDTILAGYPCQPFSMAGRRLGANDPRHLWPHIERIIGEIQPRWCFFENVSGHLTLGLEAVVRSLRGMGFAVGAGLFSAEETGATHERQRVFIVAYNSGARCQERGPARQSAANAEDGGRLEPRTERSGRDGSGGTMADADGGGRWAQGNGGISPAWVDRDGAELADSSQPGLQGRERRGAPDEWVWPAASGSAEFRRPHLHPPGPSDLVAWREVLRVYPEGAPAVSLRDISTVARYFAALVEAGELSEAEAESRIRRMADGMAARSRALRLLGNGVHPLAGAYAWRTLAAAHGLGAVDLGTYFGARANAI